VKTLLAIVFTGGLCVTAFAQPKITQVSNAASFAVAPLPNANITQGAFIAIFGSGLGEALSACSPFPAQCAWPTTFPNPTNLNGTTVTVTTSGGACSGGCPALVEFAYSGQINAVLPSKTPVGDATVTVGFNGQNSMPFNIKVVASTFGMFAQNFAGSGPGVITDNAFQVFTPFHTATPGANPATTGTAVIFGSGLGPTPDPSTEGQSGPCPAGCDFQATTTVQVYVGGVPATVLYAGGAPGLTAIDQINFTVPSGITGCYVPVAVVSGPKGGTLVTSNFGSMTIDPSGTSCSDADGINYADIASVVAAKGSANVAAISLLSNYVPINFLGSLIMFDNDTVNGEIGTFSAGVLDAFQGFTISPSSGTTGACTVVQFLQFPPPSDPELGAVTFLDAGSDLTITGGPSPMMVPKNANGKGYGALVGGATISQLLQGGGLPPYYLNSSFKPVAATYTVTGPGGSQVGSFSSSLQVSSAAAAFNWTNSSIANSPISRSSPLTLTWTGGDSNGFIDITLIGSTTQAAVEPLPTDSAELIECFVPASLGTFTVPTYVLQTLPSTTSSPSPVAGELLLGPAGATKTISPLPSGIDAAYIFYHFIAGTTVMWQ